MELLLLFIFLAVSLGILASAFVWSEVVRRDQARGLTRLGQELHKEPAPEAAERLFKNVSEFELGEPSPSLRDPAGLPSLASLEGGPPSEQTGSAAPPTRVRWQVRLRDLLRQADVRLTPPQFLAVSAAAGLGPCLLAHLALGVFLAAPALLAGGAAPWFYLCWRVNARRNKLLRQLSPAFEMMARVLRAGLSMPQAFQAVADAFEAPIAVEFARCREEQNLGVFPEVSFRGMADRTGVLELKIFVMAMLIQRQTGGNLSEVLERLAGLTRERLRLYRHIRTLTAEGRLQAVVLLVLPVVMFLVMRLINPPYTDVLLAHPEWLCATGVLMAVGALWIRKIINIE